MLAGLGRTRRVLLGDTLLDDFTPEEIEVIFAHEIGHHVFRHIRKMIVAGHGLQRGRFLDLRPAAGRLGRAGGGRSTTPPAGRRAAAVMLILTRLRHAAGAAAERGQPPLRAAVRPLRPGADRAARDAYVSAFRKLARLNKDDPDPPRLEVVLFHSHPPIAEHSWDAEE